MNHEHHLSGVESVEAVSSFCQTTMSMTMYMDGFKFSLFNKSSHCLNLYFSNFTLDTRFKFVMAMIVVMCIGVSLEGMSSLKRRYVSGLKKKWNIHNNNNNRSRNNGDFNIDNDRNQDGFLQAKFVLTGFQGLQAFTGYVLMLATMTYSIELLLSAVAGLAIGFFIFGKYKPFLRTNSDDERGGDTTGIGRGSTPCCGYDDGGASSDSTSQSDFDYIPVNGENDDIHTNHISSSLFVCKTYNSTMNENSNFNLEPVSTND